MNREECNYCDRCGRRLGMYGHLHTCKAAEQAATQSQLIQAEEKLRSDNAKNHKGACVPWRGCNGAIGLCVYCGKQVDPITAYYSDRAASCHAAKAP